ncbi:MAG: hypothetical protein HC842_02700 [Cytophagales bacterium]|nr:hypothetical protein [Cytophagales bacterium]
MTNYIAATNWCWGCLFNESWTPSGSISVEDNNLNRTDPLQGIKVVITSGLRFITTHTDHHGKFSSPLSFAAKVHYNVHFVSKGSITYVYPGTFTWDQFRIVRGSMFTATDQLNTNATRSSISHVYRPRSHNWMDAMVYKAARDYYNHLDALAYPQYGTVIRTRLDAEGISCALGAAEWIDQTGLPGSYLGFHDLVIRGRRENGNMLAFEDLYAITIHELAHITHIRNGWGDLKITLTTRSLRESYAKLIEWHFTRKRYHGRSTRASFGRYQEPLMYRDVDFRANFLDQTPNWLYTGFFIDLVDNFNQQALLSNPSALNEAFVGLSVKACEEAILGKSGVWSKALDLTSARDRIKEIRPSSEHAEIDRIHKWWQDRVDKL